MKVSESAGIGLIECMLGIAIGASLILGAVTVLQTQRQSWLLMQAVQVLQDNANAAFDTIQVSVQTTDALALQSTGDNQVLMHHLPDNDWELQEGKSRSDSFAVSHLRDLEATDCQGNVSGKQTVIRDSYQRNAKLELACKDIYIPGTHYQAIAQGVEDFQLRYAERLAGSVPGNPSLWQWKKADQLLDRQQVMAIEICLRMVSTMPIGAPSSFDVGCHEEAFPQDGKLRRVFRRVFVIRSHLETDTP